MRRPGSMVLHGVGLSLAVAASGALGDAGEVHRQHGSHVHGLGQLDVAIEGLDLVLELDSPAANLVGFEHVPASDTDHEALAQAVVTLKGGERLFRLPPGAGCRLQEVVLESPLFDEAGGAHAEASHDEDEHRAHHADLRASYHFSCADPAKVTQIEVALFAAFPRIERLDVQLVTERVQRAVTLTPKSALIGL